MFIVRKNNRKATKKTFSAYDEARCYVRKLIRKKFPETYKLFDDHHNPALNTYGYSIHKV